MFTHCTFLYLQPRAQAAHETNPNPSRAAQRRPPHPKPQSRRHYPVACRLPRRVARRGAHPTTSAPRPTPPPAGRHCACAKVQPVQDCRPCSGAGLLTGSPRGAAARPLLPVPDIAETRRPRVLDLDCRPARRSLPPAAPAS